ncbi:MAG TPA: triose-phosphate isomerase [Saprospiraceae bacterium]|nr:triose-phosphate isomerase [Saprospiraceae bacterium]
MRKAIIAGNWKMNQDSKDADHLFHELQNLDKGNAEVIVFPPFIYLDRFINLSSKHIRIGAQNCSQFSSGAYTGEISGRMLRSLGVDYVLIGHSERRQFFGETTQILKDKINIALEEKLIPIFCCGEPIIIRDNGTYIKFVSEQIMDSIGQLTPDKMAKLVIAYEPIWAIGTGVNASADQAQEMHLAIRDLINSRWGEDISDKLRILYGGSLKASNALELFNMQDIDGGLIGGASLNAEEFKQIIEIANESI